MIDLIYTKKGIFLVISSFDIHIQLIDLKTFTLGIRIFKNVTKHKIIKCCYGIYFDIFFISIHLGIHLLRKD